MRRAAHVDANQRDIVIALHRAGCTTQSLAQIGCGCPDVLVGFAGVNILLEIKNPERDTPSQRRADRESLEAQAKFREFWKGRVYWARTPEEALQQVREALLDFRGASPL